MGKEDPNKDDRKKQIKRFMFNPEIGRSTSVLGQSFDLFIRMIALILMQAGLVAKDDPAVREQRSYDERLPSGTFPRLLGQAWDRLDLTFTRDNIYPMVVFFSIIFAVVIIPVSMIIFLVGYSSDITSGG